MSSEDGCIHSVNVTTVPLTATRRGFSPCMVAIVHYRVRTYVSRTIYLHVYTYTKHKFPVAVVRIIVGVGGSVCVYAVLALHKHVYVG